MSILLFLFYLIGDFYLYEADQITLYDVTIQCFLSRAPHRPIELAWFKETECICLYKNGQVIKGRGYENRVSLFPEQLKKGNVSLTLQGFKNSDAGDYTCQVTDGGRTKQITVRVGKERLLYRIQNMANNIVVGALVMLLAVVIGAAAAIGAAVVIGAIVIASAILTNITFMIINRQWSPHETQKMERTALFAETQASLNERDKRIEDYCKHQLAVLKIELQEEIKVLGEGFKHQQDTLNVKQQEEMKMLREDFKHQLATLKVKQQEEIKMLSEERLNNNSLKINRVLAPQCSGPNKIQSSNTPGTVYTNSVPLPPHFNGGRKAGDFGGNS
nr:uncharacterized protein LOC129439905 isoform X1 [Misgurnus anguillicaudatus]